MDMKIQFNMDGDAFFESREFAIREILNSISYRVTEYHTEGVIKDANGSRIGEWSISD